MRYRLYHPESFDTGNITTALATHSVTAIVASSPQRVQGGEDPSVLLLDAHARKIFSPTNLRNFVEQGGAIVALGTDGETDLPDDLPEEVLSAFLPSPYSVRHLLIALRTAFRDSATRAETVRLRAEASARTQELNELTRIGVALATERDYNALQETILSQARRVTGSDAGSLYLVERPEGAPRRLRFKLAQNYSRPEIPLVEFTIPIDHYSIAGYVASTGEPLVIDDAYFLPPDVEYTFNRSIDEKYDYRTRSMLTIPMTNNKNEVIGVLQLINRKRDFDTRLTGPDDFQHTVTPYSRRIVDLVSALAGQAAVSIENSQLYEDIERLFEGFVTAAVTAIEQRDPTTFGHSGRVASMTVAIAETVDGVSQGRYRDLNFSREQLREIRYAGLLHDFGKVGVREQVLVKAKKLYPPDLALVKQRYGFIMRTAEREFYRKRVEYLEQHGKSEYDKAMADMQAGFDAEMEKLNRFLQLVLESNEPTVLPEGNFDELLRYAEVFYEDLEGNEQAYLTGDEVRYLTIRKGSLDDTERLEIESHVNHTYRFLMQIPWTNELQNIPMIAYGHHEKLDGRGYPRGVKEEDIPVQTRMMTIADIFDALTASDRPYKRAVPAERALDIMTHEVRDGMLDADLFNLFTEVKVYETVGS